MLIDRKELINLLNNETKDVIDLKELILKLSEDNASDSLNENLNKITETLICTRNCTKEAIFFRPEVLHYAVKGDINTQLEQMFGEDKVDICDFIKSGLDTIKVCTDSYSDLVNEILGHIEVADDGINRQLELLLRLLITLAKCDLSSSEVLYVFLRPMKYVDGCKDNDLNSEILRFKSSPVYMNLLLLKVKVDTTVVAENEELISSIKVILNFLATYIPKGNNTLGSLLEC